MADWLRCADIVVGKAGPGTIAEATCCGAPLVLTSFVPGQEKGNAEFVTGVGRRGVRAAAPPARRRDRRGCAATRAPSRAMRDAAVRAGRPGAAADIARFLAELAGHAEAADRPRADPGDRRRWPTTTARASPANAHCSPPSSAGRSRGRAPSSWP